MVDEVPGVESLCDEELAVLARFVRALVHHDEAVLRNWGAYDGGGDPYMFTRDWRMWDHVDLIMPPGEPKTWEMGVYRDGSTLPAAIVLDMFTVQEGPGQSVRRTREATRPYQMWDPWRRHPPGTRPM